ncbi:MAG TPA: O-antigen ligase family protein, partial [bacterium]|nr:O-antigen ligase family protein [bacterium]
LLVLLLAETGALVVGYRTGHLPHLSSFQDRMRYWQAAMRVFQQWPWLGVGPGQFRFFYLRFKAPGAMEARHAHSLFFETLAEKGIWGTLVFFSLMALLLWKLVPFSGREITLEESLGLGFLAGWLHFLVDVSFIDEAVSSLFFLLAGWALSRKKGCPFPGRKGLTTITKRLTPAISYLIILIVVSAGILRIRINQAITYLDRADKVRYLNERLEWLRKARQLYPLSEFFVQEGDGYMMAANITGDGSWLVRAEEAYRMALARNQFSAIPYRKLALLYAQEKRWRKAEQMYLKCLENYPTKKQYVLELASLYRHTGQMEKYQHYLALALALPAVTKEEDDYTRRLLDGQDRSDRNAAGR